MSDKKEASQTTLGYKAMGYGNSAFVFDNSANVISNDKCQAKEVMPKDTDLMREDNVNHPKHYTKHPSGIECIQITEHYNFCIGNAIKYLWRSDLKNGVEDLKKAIWYITREIENRSREQ